MKLDILATLNAEREARRAAIVITDITSGKQRLVKAADIGKDPLRSALAEHLRTGKSGMEDTAEGREPGIHNHRARNSWIVTMDSGQPRFARFPE